MTINAELDIKNLVDNNLDYYERCLLSTIVNNSLFWFERCKPNVNTKKSKFENFRDFSKPIDNDLYNTVTTFYSALVVNGSIPANIKLNKEILLGAIKSTQQSQISINQDYIETIKSRINIVLEENFYSEAVLNIAEKGFDYWLDFKRAKQLVSSVLNKPTSIQELLDLAKKESDKLVKKKSDDSKDILSILDSYNLEEDDDTWMRIPFASLPKLTDVMGGGIKKQESMLIIAPPGGGKTTISCQIGVALAEADNKVIYITTEQPGAELLPKMISCGAMVPYEKIMDGIKREDLNPENPLSKLSKSEIKRIKEFIPKIQNTLWFEDWCSSGAKLKAHLGNTIEQHIKEHNGIDCVIIDWIGGGLDMEAADGSLKRHFLDECCRIIKDAAIKYNVAIIACSQASQTKAEDISFITAAEISESTMLHTYFTWALGISALGVNKKNQKAALNGEIENKKTTQYFNVFKTRKSKGKAYPVFTNFDYSRFEENNGSPNVNDDIAKQPIARKIEHDVTNI